MSACVCVKQVIQLAWIRAHFTEIASRARVLSRSS